MSESPEHRGTSNDPGSEPVEGNDGTEDATTPRQAPAPAPAPPYPGWSTAQPPQREWQAPGHQAPPPSGPPGAGTAPAQAGQPQPAGWGSGAAWGWAQAVKPGVIPLRPLGVGEILDGAVTTIRRNPGSMLGLSAIVAVVVQLTGLIFSWMIIRNLDDIATTASPTTDEVFSLAAGTLTGAGIMAAVDWLGTIILTGILTVVVSRAVLGEKLTIGQAWSRARPRLLKLIGLTLLYTLIWLGPFIVVFVFTLLLALSGAEAGAVLVAVLFGLASLPLTIWLYVRYALAAPALMLETTTSQYDNRGPQPIGVGTALRRSAELVRRSWWRVFGILLLVLLITVIVTQVLSLPFSIPLWFIDPLETTSFTVVAVATLGAILATTITAPFVAGAVALLYVDRRIRAEALDIELARAAGVTIPGRTDQQGPYPGAP